VIALLRIAVIAALVGALELACRAGWVAPTTVIPPTAMAAAAWHILRSGAGAADIEATSARVLAAAAISALGGGLAGFALHAAPRLRRALEPVLSSWYAIPTVLFYPVLIVAFGVGAGSIVAIAVLLAAVSMVGATLAGLDRVPPVLLRSARAMRLTALQAALRVRIPAAAPYLFTGLKLVVAYAFIGVIAAEFILSGSGVGYAIANAYNNFETATMYGLMLLIVVAVTLVNALLQAADQRLRARRTP
jgi:NitT/TauT family transport system permease protein